MNIFSKFYCRSVQFVFKLAIPFLPYRKPLIYNSIDELRSIFKNKKVLIVSDRGIEKAGIIDKIVSILNKEDISYSLFLDTVPNPTISNVEAGLKVYLENNCECILAVGGGSPIDLGKVIGARVVRGKKPVVKMRGLFKVMKKTPLIVAVPTTAGTGSEVTVAAVITNDETHEKYPINDFNLIPSIAVLDPSLTVGLPPHITSTTGMDALTHAVEAYIGRSTTKETRRYAKLAVKLIVENIKEVYVNPTNISARKNMLDASHYAGIAFTVSYVGYVHSIAHSLGGKYNVPHGLANAVILPVVLKKYGKSVHKKIAQLAYYSGIAASDVNICDACNLFINWIEETNKFMNIPDCFNVVKEEDLNDLSSAASREANPLYPVPVLYNKEELKEIYRKLK